MRRVQQTLLPILLLIYGASAVGSERIPTGEIIDPVPCRKAPGQSYALFLPSAYDAAKRWPVIYVLDARGRGAYAAELFESAAERLGWIIVSSNNSMSDDSMQVIVDAMKAAWTDSHERLSIDDGRIHIAGFSGTARFATLADQLVPVHGVIGVGAGFVPDAKIPDELPWLYFGAAGYEDFNYYELFSLDETLDSSKGSHRIVFFEGSHGWPPPEVCAWAMEWMQIQTMKQGLIPADGELIRTSLERQIGKARDAMNEGRPADALVIDAAIMEDFEGLEVDLSDVRSEFERLSRQRNVTSVLRSRKRQNETDLRVIARASGLISGAISPGAPLVHPADLIRDLGIARLKKQADDEAKLDESRAATRILATLFVQTSFYLPRALLAQGDGRRATICYEVAEAIHPDDPRVQFGLARSNALAGHRKEALRALNRAVDLGLDDPSIIESHAELESIRNEPEYQRILERLRAPTPDR